MPTAANYSAAVQELYISYFGRPADYNGLLNFEAALAAANAPTDLAGLNASYNTNPAVRALIDSFGTSSESKALYGTVDATNSATAFISAIFENLFNRAPNAAGLAFWSDAITSGNLTSGNAALSIAAGAATNTSPQGVIDATTVSNKVAIAADFTADLLTPTDIAGYSGHTAAASARSMIAGVSNTTSLTGFQTTVQETVWAIVNPVVEIDLTTGVDNLVGVSLNNLFGAVLDNSAGIAAGGPTATLNAGDKITGGPGLNSLFLSDMGLNSTLSIPAGASITGINILKVFTSESLGTQDFSSWSGLSNVVISASTSAGADTITVGAATALLITDDGAPGSLTTNGGTSISVLSDINHAITINGGATTTSVNITGGNGMHINGADTITNVSFTDSTGVAHIAGNGLTALSVTGSNSLSVYMEATVDSTTPLTANISGDSKTQLEIDTPTVFTINETGLPSTDMAIVDQHGVSLVINDESDLSLTVLNSGYAQSVSLAGSGNTSISQVDTDATTLTIADSGSGTVSIDKFYNTELKSLTLSNTSTAATAAFTISGVTTFQNLQNLTLSGHVAVNVTDLNVSAGLTLAGAGDNADVTFLAAYNTASGNTDSIVLGDGMDKVTLGDGAAASIQNITLGMGGNDSITTGSTGTVTIVVAGSNAGTDSFNATGSGVHLNITTDNGGNLIAAPGSNDVVNIVTGTSIAASLGNNYISLGAGASGTITLGEHTGIDEIFLGAFGTTPNLANIVAISGLNASAGDSISFAAGPVTSVQEVHAWDLPQTGTGVDTLSDWIATAVGLNGKIPQNAGGVEWFTYYNTTYVVFTASAADAGLLSSADTVVELGGQNFSFFDSSISNGALLLDGGGPAQGSYTLTTGADIVTGNNFNAILDNANGIAAGGPQATLNGGDTLTSSGGTLNITDYGLGSNMALPASALITGMGTLNINSTEAVSGADGAPLNLSAWTNLANVNIMSSSGADNLEIGGSGNGSIRVNIVDSGPSVSLTEGLGFITNTIEDANFGSAKANTLTAVSIDGLIINGISGGSDTGIYSSVLNTLTLSGLERVTVVGGAATLTLNLNQASSGTIVDNGAVVLDIEATSAETFNFGVAGTSMTTMDVHDDAGLTLASLAAPHVNSLVLTGVGLFTADLTGLAPTVSIDARASSGTDTLTLSGGESFAGGTGRDIVTIGHAQTGALIGGSATDNELILNNFGAITEADLPAPSHFSILGFEGNTHGTFDLSKTNGINAIDVQHAGGDITVSNVLVSMPLDISDAHGDTITWKTADANGATDTATIELGNAGYGFTGTANVTLEDSKAAGIGTVNLFGIASNNPANEFPNTLNITDTNLVTLNLSGNYAANITLLGDTATSLTIDNSGYPSTYNNVVNINDNALSTLTLTGSKALNISSFVDGATTLVINDDNSAPVSINYFSAGPQITDSLTSLTLKTDQTLSTFDPQYLNPDSSAAAFNAVLVTPALQTLALEGNMSVAISGDAITGNITVNGATDNAYVGFVTTGTTVTGATDSITLGNGNDAITLAGGAAGASHHIVLGSGNNTVTDNNLGTTTISTAEPASGRETISTNGGNLSITVGDGTDSIYASSASNATIGAGNGNDTINFEGPGGSKIGFTVGNGNNTIILDASNDTGHITVGTGSNTIQLSDGTGVQITLGAHTGADTLKLTSLGANTHLTAINTISGLNNVGTDTINFQTYGNIAAGAMVQITDANVLAASTSDATLENWIATATGLGAIVPQTQHNLVWFQFQGNTYLVNISAATDAGVINANDNVVELIGTNYTFAHSTVTSGTLHLLG